MQSNILNIENWSSYKDEVDDYIVNQYYIYCVTDNCNIGYPIKYCPVCGAKLE